MPGVEALLSRWPWATGAVASCVILVGLVFMARWPRVETPLDATWVGVAVGAGAGMAAELGLVSGLAEPWVAVAGLTAGAVLGSLSGLSWRWPSSLAKLVLGGLSLGWAVGGQWLWMAAFAQVRSVWALWIAGSSVVLLALALGLWAEERVLQPQLEEEAGYGLIPLWVARAGGRFWRRFSRRWAERRDERKAMVRLVVRLAACKAYLAGKGKHRSTAAVELGRLRDRARRLFAPAPTGLES